MMHKIFIIKPNSSKLERGHPCPRTTNRIASRSQFQGIKSILHAGNLYRFILFLSILTLLASCTSAKKEKFDLLITNANIVDVEKGSIQQEKLIGITRDTIRIVDDMAQESQYEAQQMLDAQGQYVMPGLWDNHVHFRGGDSLIQENKNLLPLFLAYGVTTVRDAGGDITPAVMSWRNDIQKSTMNGPTIFTSGPKLDGINPAWEGSLKVVTLDDIDPALDSLQAIGTDYVKMYDGSLTKEVFYGIIQAAEERGLQITGHMPLSAFFREAITYGLDGTEHMYYVMKACSPVEDSLTALNTGYQIMDAVIDTYDPQLADTVFAEMREHHVFITPTLHVGKTLAEILDTDHTKDTVLTYIGAGIQQTYQRRVEAAKRARNSGNNTRKKMETLSQQMIPAMHEAGVSIMAGSDCGPYNSFVYPGESILQELKLLTEAGLTPQQALQTSVINGPKFFGLENYYGSVDNGKMADLIILKKNPLENIEYIGNITTVIARGKAYNEVALREMLQSVKRD